MHGGSAARFPTKPTEKLKIEKMYAIKQIKICAEYRDMLPRPRLDLSGTPGLRPIGLSPGSWQTSLGLGSMSRYSAQILICITNGRTTRKHNASGAYRQMYKNRSLFGDLLEDNDWSNLRGNSCYSLEYKNWVHYSSSCQNQYQYMVYSLSHHSSWKDQTF